MSLGVDYGNDLNLVQEFPEDNRKRIAVEHYPLGTVNVGWIESWPFL